MIGKFVIEFIITNNYINIEKIKIEMFETAHNSATFIVNKSDLLWVNINSDICKSNTKSNTKKNIHNTTKKQTKEGFETISDSITQNCLKSKVLFGNRTVIECLKSILVWISDFHFQSFIQIFQSVGAPRP